VSDDNEKPKSGFFSRISAGLRKTRESLTDGIAKLVLGEKVIDESVLEEIETSLLIADVGVTATTIIIDDLTRRVKRRELANAGALFAHLREHIQQILQASEAPLDVSVASPFVILMVGVNGAGKTTTAGKLARNFSAAGRSVLLAAGDTYRAAAVEQLQVWGDRNNVPVVSQGTGADSASVIYDAFSAAKSRDIDVLIADTAGRLQSKANLMEELTKIHRVVGKLDDSAPHEVLLVIDAGTGQNALSQARLFMESCQVSGIALTKLDGTAKGGIVVAIARELGLPIRYVGVGEGIDDLRPFDAGEFVNALLPDPEVE
jgi:fused signal recognition particle receptor